MIIGFTGTRHGMTDLQKEVLLNLINSTSAIQYSLMHYGMCKGADDEAFDIVRRSTKWLIHGHPPIDTKLFVDRVCDKIMKPAEYLERNRNIVNLCHILVAAPKETIPQKRGGTWYTIRYAESLNKPIIMLWPK